MITKRAIESSLRNLIAAGQVAGFVLVAIPVPVLQVAAAPAAMLQFTAAGHALGFQPGGMYAAAANHALHVEFLGANEVQPQAEGSGAGLDGKASPLGRVTYKNLWSGIDLAYSADAAGIYQTTYTLAPGADPAEIRLAYNAPLAVQEDGTLAIAFETGTLAESAPVAWQEIAGVRALVEVSFRVAGKEAGFLLGAYDPRYAVMIDPSLTWHTFLGGVSNDQSMGIAVDGSGNVYTVGISSVSWGTPVRAFSGQTDTYITKLNGSDGSILWSTFLGSYGTDYGYGIAVDGSGNLYAVGSSYATWGTPVRAHNGSGSSYDGYVAKLAAADGSLTWNTFLGGSGSDQTSAISVDGSGNAYVAGLSTATWGSPGRAYTAGTDGYAALLTSSGALSWSTFLGGSGDDRATGIAFTNVGPGAVYVVGRSNATWGPSPVRSYTGDTDAFVVKLSTTGSMSWNTFLGGSGSDDGNGIAVNSDGAYVVGTSTATWGSPVRGYSSGTDAYVAGLNSSGVLSWNTFLGSANSDEAMAIALDGSGNLYVAGTSGTTWGSPVNIYTGNSDAFAAKLTSAGSVTWNSFIGGSGGERAFGVAVDSSARVYLAGHGLSSWGTPTRAYLGGWDGLAARLNDDGSYYWHTYQGVGGSDAAQSLVVDGSGNIYIAGYSETGWGSTVRRYYTNNFDGFVAKLDASGALVWVSFLGGAGNDFASSVSVDGSGNVYAAGDSSSTWGSPVRAFSGSTGGFAAKLDSSGTLVWNAFLGGAGATFPTGIAADAGGNVFITGSSTATWGSPIREYSSGQDVFVTELASDGGLTWNTFLGTSGTDSSGGIVLGTDGVYVAGSSSATWGSPVRSYSAGYDGFVAKLTTSGGLTWNTFLGGSGADYSHGVGVDGAGNVYLAGNSNAAWSCTPSACTMHSYAGGTDVYAAKLTSAGALTWVSFVGGSSADIDGGIAVDTAGNLYLTGSSGDVWGNPVRAFGGGQDAFAAGLSPSGNLVWNTFLGGSANDQGYGIDTDAVGRVFVAGGSDATWGNPVAVAPGGSDAFVAELSPILAFLPLAIWQ